MRSGLASLEESIGGRAKEDRAFTVKRIKRMTEAKSGKENAKEDNREAARGLQASLGRRERRSASNRPSDKIDYRMLDKGRK